MASLLDQARLLKSDISESDPALRADRLATRLREENPEASAKATADAAASAVGIETPTSGARRAAAHEREGRGKARSRKTRARRAVRRTKKAARRPGVISLGTRTGRATAGGLFSQMLGLLLLYWLLRNTAAATTGLAGLRRGVEWLIAPRGIP